MQKKWHWGAALVLLAGSLFVSRTLWPLPDKVAARIDGDDITLAALDVFVAAARRKEASLDRETVLEGLIENRLLANIADRQEIELSGGRVGYDYTTRMEQQRFKLIRSAFAEPLQSAIRTTDAPNSLEFLTRPLALDAENLKPLLGLRQQLYSSMTAAQRKSAQSYALAHYRFEDNQPERVLTLWELYRRQNIQLKMQLHSLNLEFMREAIRQYLNTAYVLDWFERKSGLDADSRAIVERCVDDALTREIMLQQMGLLQDAHDGNPQLRALATQVTADEIADYYRQHREEFTRIERVHAYHIRVDNQEMADRVHREVQAGLPFAEAVANYSSAADRTRGGELGWIDRDSRQGHWIRALAFVQPLEQISPPYRSPQTGEPVYWELLWVDSKETGYQPLDSESVRYRAANAIAQEKLQQRFRRLLAEVRDSAQVRVNRGLIACESC